MNALLNSGKRQHWQGPIAILGAGVSGQGLVQLCQSQGVPYVIFDKNTKIGEPTFDPVRASDFEWVTYSPSFHADHPWLLAAHEAGRPCLTELDAAALFWHGPIVAITGTVGKSTLTEFLAFALEKSGQPAVAVGNNGNAFSGISANKALNDGRWALCEVSSFQAEQLQYLTPHSVLWTNFYENHLDAHKTIEAYFFAKANLVSRLKTPYFFTGESVLSVPMSRLLPAPMKVVSAVQREAFRLPGTCFDTFPQRENYLLARAWWESCGFKQSDLEAAAKTFVPPQHRLACIAEIAGVRFWNDSKATTSAAVRAALRTFPTPVSWICGGRSKGQPLPHFVAEIGPELKNVAKAYLIGEVAHDLQPHLTAAGVDTQILPSLEQAVHVAFDEKRAAHIVLSPGFTSFDAYKDYAHRGDVFCQIVADLQANKKNKNYP